MASSGRVLVIDDSWAILDTIRAQLSPEGYDVKVASDLPTAAKHVHTVDLCVVDFHMPGLDGKSILVALKAALGPEQRCKFYLYTSDADVARRAVELGFDGSFMKKGDAALLVYQVGAVFRMVRMAQIDGKRPSSAPRR
jgi:CheY-like chemotaxis protein